jgi:hypothetical protein
MSREKLGFILKCLSYRNVLINLFLRTAFYTIIAQVQGIYLSLQKVKSVRALVHQIDLRDDS